MSFTKAVILNLKNDLQSIHYQYHVVSFYILDAVYGYVNGYCFNHFHGMGVFLVS